MLTRRIAAVAVAAAACGAPRRVTTPSGTPCADLPVYPAGTEPPQAFHRLGPVQSKPRDTTEAERLASLRAVACATGADAVVEAVTEEQRQADASVATIASGTAVVWTAPAPASAPPLDPGAPP